MRSFWLPESVPGFAGSRSRTLSSAMKGHGSMSAKEAFGVVLRLIGIVLCLLSLWYFVYVPVVLVRPEVWGCPVFLYTL